MEYFLTPSNITYILGLLGVLFAVYHYFKNPQIAGDKKDALLAQKVQWQNEAIEKRFKDMQDNFNALLLQSNNHIHTVDVKVDNMGKSIAGLSNEITRLGTIINERIPKSR